MVNPQHSPDEPSPFVGLMRKPPSAVAHRSGLLAPVLGGMGVALLGIFVFASLSAHRTQTQPATTIPANSEPSQADLANQRGMVVPTPPGAAGPMPGMVLAPPPPMAGAPMMRGATLADRLHAPSLVVDLGGESGSGTLATATPAAGGPGATAQGESKDGNADTAFTAKLAATATETVAPTRLADNARVAPQGTIIPAVLETAINSDLPGYTRAIVSRDVRGYDGTTVLIPRGSRLIGQYRNAVAVGQSRAFVVWTRLITPAGLSLDIQSPGTDSMGRSGLEGETHTHFFRRFGNAILLSVINAALQAGVNSVGNASTAIIIGSQAQATNVATLALQKEINVPDTVTVNQGAPIQIFVARDLDFTGVVGPRR